MIYHANTQTDVKLNNQKTIIDFLLVEGPASRADIAKQINSSKPTVSKNVDELLRNNMLTQLGKADNSIGKKAVLLDVNKDFGYVLGIDLSKNSIKLSINNLRYEEINYSQYLFDNIVNIKVIIDHFLKDSKLSLNKIMKVVIAYPGVVGHNGSTYLTNLNEKEMVLNELTQFIKNKFSYKPIIKNDINLAILAEQHYNQYVGAKNMYYVSVDVGVGAGIIINGQLYEGDRNAAGEIGFIVPSKDNSFSTLEELISINALLNRYHSKTQNKINFDELIELIEIKDKVACDIYNEVVEYISVAISNISSILDITNVVIAGKVMNINQNMAGDISKRVNSITPFETIIKRSRLEHSALKGGILIGINEIINEMI